MISGYLLAPLLAVTLACAGSDAAPGASARAADTPVEGGTVAPAARPVIVFLGTSLTVGLGIDIQRAYPALIQRRIDAAGLDFVVQNAGVSGETSAGARRRIDWLMAQQPPAVLVVETGANDGLRGLDPDALRDNLDAILDRASEQEPAPAVVVIGMEAPPNFGRSYTNRFRAAYAEVAAEHDAAFVPFLLEGVAAIDSLNQADGIHPTPAGQRIIAETVWRVLEPVLRARAR
jgi:acyl-CoA thioesterase-1